MLEATEERIVARLATSAGGATGPVAALRARCAAWLDLAAEDPVLRRIVLTEAPGVIGSQAWHALDERHPLGLIRAALAAATAAAGINDESMEVSASVLVAVLVEVALLITRAGDDVTVARNGRKIVDHFLDSLFSALAVPPSRRALGTRKSG